ncbi:MAG: hypothetical protein Q9195_007543 [Heterodermia aff. obscurata]
MSETDLHYVPLEECFNEFGEITEFDLPENFIKVQPASDVPSACDQVWRSLEPIVRIERTRISPTATIDDIFPSLTSEYRPQLFHYCVHEDGRAAIAWRIPFVPGKQILKSLMIALMMWKGIADHKREEKRKEEIEDHDNDTDQNHVWHMLGHGVELQSLDIFLWGFITEEEKAAFERYVYPKSLELLGDPAKGFMSNLVRIVSNARDGIHIPFEE